MNAVNLSIPSLLLYGRTPMPAFACVFNGFTPVLKGSAIFSRSQYNILHDIALRRRVSGIRIAFYSSTKRCGLLLLRIPTFFVAMSHVSTHTENERPKDITLNVFKVSG